MPVLRKRSGQILHLTAGYPPGNEKGTYGNLSNPKTGVGRKSSSDSQLVVTGRGMPSGSTSTSSTVSVEVAFTGPPVEDTSRLAGVDRNLDVWVELSTNFG